MALHSGGLNVFTDQRNPLSNGVAVPCAVSHRPSSFSAPLVHPSGRDFHAFVGVVCFRLGRAHTGVFVRERPSRCVFFLAQRDPQGCTERAEGASKRKRGRERHGKKPADNKRKDKQTSRQAHEQTNERAGRQTNRQPGRQADRETDRQTDGQTDRQTHRSTYRGGAHLKNLNR